MYNNSISWKALVVISLIFLGCILPSSSFSRDLTCKVIATYDDLDNVIEADRTYTSIATKTFEYSYYPDGRQVAGTKTVTNVPPTYGDGLCPVCRGACN